MNNIKIKEYLFFFLHWQNKMWYFSKSGAPQSCTQHNGRSVRWKIIKMSKTSFVWKARLLQLHLSTSPWQGQQTKGGNPLLFRFSSFNLSFKRFNRRLNKRYVLKQSRVTSTVDLNSLFKSLNLSLWIPSVIRSVI